MTDRRLDPRNNPDPRHVDEDDVWDPQVGAWVPRKSGLLALLAGLVFGIFLGAVLVLAIGAVAGVYAAPRSAQTSPAALSGAPPILLHASTSSAAPATVAAAERTAAPTPGPELGTAIEGGIASYVGQRFGDRYLALPEGPGRRVRICIPGYTRCVERTSTDAGPDLAMQRAGRIADLSFADFAWLCRCDPPLVGLISVTVERGGGPGFTPPPTDLDPEGAVR